MLTPTADSPILQLTLDSKGHMRSIYQVAPGLECNCFCPACGGHLIANNAEEASPSCGVSINLTSHFSHHRALGDCSAASDIMLHRLAIEVLRSTKKLMIPRLRSGEEILAERRLIHFDHVEETKTHQVGEGRTIVPAVTLTTTRGRVLFIEFTYPLHPERAIIQEAGISCLYIDLLDISPLNGREPNMKDMIWLLHECEAYKTWVYNAAEKRLRKSSLKTSDGRTQMDTRGRHSGK